MKPKTPTQIPRLYVLCNMFRSTKHPAKATAREGAWSTNFNQVLGRLEMSCEPEGSSFVFVFAPCPRACAAMGPPAVVVCIQFRVM